MGKMLVDKIAWPLLAAWLALTLLFPGPSVSGDLEPSAPPQPTMHTLNEIYNLTRVRQGFYVMQTGQTESAIDGDDGDLQAGVPFPRPRFSDNLNGTVTDNLTGLVWLKNAGCFSAMTWETAVAEAGALASGTCGLSDSSSAGSWRLPNIRELKSLVHYGFFNPALPDTEGSGRWSAGDPFTNVRTNENYWTGTTYFSSVTNAWSVWFYTGIDEFELKDKDRYVWPVKGGK